MNPKRSTLPNDANVGSASAREFSQAGERSSRHLSKLLLGLLTLAAIGVSVWWLYGRDATSETNDISVHTVERRTLRDLVVESGSLESQKTVDGKCELPGESKIVFIVPEGNSVKEGDEVVRFDTEEIDRLISEKKVEVSEAKGGVETARQEVKVKKNESDSLVSDARFALAQAKISLEKYRDGDYLSKVAEIKRSISEGEAELENSIESLQNFRALVKKGYRSPEQLREIEFLATSNRHRLDRDRRNLEVLEKYTYKEEITKLEHAVKDGKLKLDRAITTAEAEKLKAESEVKRAERKLDIEQKELTELEEQRGKCVITAPQPGTIAYANKRWYSDDRKIREGATVYNGRSVFQLPDMTRMQVKVSVHESVVNKVKEDQKTSIRIFSFPDHKFRGTVKKVSQLASSTWWQSTQNYEVIVHIDEIPEGVDLKPGMTAEVEVKVGVYKDVLAVPVTTLTEHFGQSYVFCKRGNDFERQHVSVGRVTNSFVEITEGIKLGDQLAMDAYQRGLLEFGDENEEAAASAETDVAPEGAGEG